VKKTLFILSVASFAYAMPAAADDQAPSQADYDCANYGECKANAEVEAADEGSVRVGQTRGMNIAGRFGKKVTEPNASSVAPRVVSNRTRTEPNGLSGARARVTAPVASRAAPATVSSTRLKLAQGISFVSGSAELTTSARYNVDMLAASLLRADKLERRFRIEGHTDAVGDDRSNQLLSERRSAAVVNYLVAKGVDRSRLEIAGFGESQLLQDTAPNASANRRVVAKPLN
jgi:OmpA-OmpF porin, OOP family